VIHIDSKYFEDVISLLGKYGMIASSDPTMGIFDAKTLKNNKLSNDDVVGVIDDSLNIEAISRSFNSKKEYDYFCDVKFNTRHLGQTGLFTKIKNTYSLAALTKLFMK